MKNKNSTQKSFLVISHTYQPPRNFLKLAECEVTEERASILSGVNEQVYNDCYKPVFINNPKIPRGMMFSFYGTLREWMKEHHTKDFVNLKQKINKLKDKEYYVLCDAYLHPILPLMNENDQDMIIKIGKRAFEEDFGFTPRGFWLPELAVSSLTLRLLYKNGFEFVVLRDEQVKNTKQNPVYIDKLAILHFDKELSETVWFHNEATIIAENFLQQFPQKPSFIFGTDTEVYGHLLSYKNDFLSYVTQKKVLSNHNFIYLDVKKTLTRRRKYKTKIYEFSSWSCPHGIKRWTGYCLCDTTDVTIIKRIKSLHKLTQIYTYKINKALDKHDASWRENFIKFFLKNRRAIFEKGTLAQSTNNLFKAKLAALMAQTSCFAFFRDSDDRPEREIAQINIEQIKKLLKIE